MKSGLYVPLEGGGTLAFFYEHGLVFFFHRESCNIFNYGNCAATFRFLNENWKQVSGVTASTAVQNAFALLKENYIYGHPLFRPTRTESET